MLVPNLRGLESALSAGVKEIAIFAAASESFTQKNINCSIEESIIRYNDVMEQATQHKLKVRGYVSCVLGCPYEARSPPTRWPMLRSDCTTWVVTKFHWVTPWVSALRSRHSG